jgi:hypothetical protein
MTPEGTPIKDISIRIIDHIKDIMPVNQNTIVRILQEVDSAVLTRFQHLCKEIELFEQKKSNITQRYDQKITEINEEISGVEQKIKNLFERVFLKKE